MNHPDILLVHRDREKRQRIALELRRAKFTVVEELLLKDVLARLHRRMVPRLLIIHSNCSRSFSDITKLLQNLRDDHGGSIQTILISEHPPDKQKFADVEYPFDTPTVHEKLALAARELLGRG